MADRDRQLDDRLRDTPVPAGLVRRLQAIAAAEDAALDRRLREVTVPTSLKGRLQQVVRDVERGHELQNVPVPLELINRVQQLHRPRTTLPWYRAAIAAVLLIGLWSAYLATFSRLAVWLQPQTEVSRAEQAHALQVSLQTPTEVKNFPERWARETTVDDAIHVPLTRVPAIPLAERAPLTSLGMGGALLARIDSGLQPWADTLLTRWGPLGAPHTDEPTTLEMPRMPQPRGMRMPRVPGYDRRFLLTKGIHPPVFPAVHPRLLASQPPLVTRRESFQVCRELAAQRRVPTRDQVQVEEFLAATSPRLENHVDELKLQVIAGQAPFGNGQQSLLEVIVAAPNRPPRQDPSAHLTLAIDTSASMRWNKRMEWVRRSLRRLLTVTEPGDRVSLVAFDQDILHEVDAAGLADRERLDRIVRQLAARGGTNLARGLQRGASLALSNTTIPSRLVVLTDGNPRWTSTTAAQTTSMLADLRRQDVQVTIVDLSLGSALDAELEKLGDGSGGRVVKPASEVELYWTLLTSLGGKSPEIAREARLTVRFNPRVVRAYRLVGNETNALAWIAPPKTESTVRAGQAAVVLYEVWLRDSARDESAVSAELQWSSPRGNLLEVRRDSVNFNDFSSTAPTLRLGAVAAEAAEILRGSYDFSITSSGQMRWHAKRRRIRHVLEEAATLAEILPDNPAVQEFHQFLGDLHATLRIR